MSWSVPPATYRDEPRISLPLVVHDHDAHLSLHYSAQRRAHDPRPMTLMLTKTSRSRVDVLVSQHACSRLVDWLNTKLLKSFKAVLHGFERFGGVPLPIRDLARDPQRLPGAV